jgi:hypothetical protein
MYYWLTAFTQVEKRVTKQAKLQQREEVRDRAKAREAFRVKTAAITARKAAARVKVLDEEREHALKLGAAEKAREDARQAEADRSVREAKAAKDEALRLRIEAEEEAKRKKKERGKKKADQKRKDMNEKKKLLGDFAS